MLVIGLGNPILGDDGVGWKVAELVRQQFSHPAVDIECLALGGLRLMEFMVGYDYAVLIDAMTTWQGPLGSLHRFPLENMADLTAGHTTSSHDTSLQTALKMGRQMGLRLPTRVDVVGIEAHMVFDFSESLSEPVEAAAPEAARLVMDLLHTHLRRTPPYDLA
jgi:hydrogenase maturation protease